MLDVAVAYNRFKFLGYEFLTWLWFVIEKQRSIFSEIDSGLTSLDIGNRLVLENRNDDAVESIIIKGDDAGLEEGILALKKGAMVKEINLIAKIEGSDWRFTIKGDSFDFTNFKTPDPGRMETGDDLEGLILEKIYLYGKIVVIMDKFYEKFLKLRLGEKWNDEVLISIKKWINE